MCILLQYHSCPAGVGSKELWLNQIFEKNKHLKKQNKKKIINIQWCKCDRQQVIDPLHEEEREVIKKGAEPAEGVVRETKGQKRG